MTEHIGDVTQMIPMTQQRLAEIEARCEAATHGRRGYDDESCAIVVGDKCLFVEGSDATEADLEFELHSLDDCESLLAEVERLRAEVERFRAKRNETIDAIENLMESCRACDMCALNESDDTCSDNGEGYCSPVWIGRKEED